MQLERKIEKHMQNIIKKPIIYDRKYLDDEQLDRDEQFQVLRKIFDVDVRDREIKELFKQAFLELLEERRDMLYDLFAEVIEDLALANAIREGEPTETVSKAEVMQILEGAA